MNETEQRVWSHLTRWHRGRDNAITIESLAEIVCLPRRACHDVVTDLIVGHRCPIAAHCGRPAGIYVIQSHAERIDYARSLKKRALAILVRLRAVNQAALWELGVQPELFHAALHGE